MNKEEVKLLFGIFILPLASFLITFALYFLSFNIVNKVNPQSYYLYATNGKYNKDIFFSDSVNKTTKIFDGAITEIVKKTNTKISRKQDIFGAIVNNPKLSEKLISANKKYMDYLDKQNLEIDDVINYSVKMYEVDNNIMKASFYLAFTICILIDLFCLKNRKRIYVVALIVYLLSNLDSFTVGLSSQTIYNLPFISSKMTHDDFQLFLAIMLPALKEAFLTFIIVDSIYQALLQVKSDLALKNEHSLLKYEIERKLEQASHGINKFVEMFNGFKENLVEIENDVVSCHDKLKKIDSVIQSLNTTVDGYSEYIEETAASAENIVKLLNNKKAPNYDKKQKSDDINKPYEKERIISNKYIERRELIDNTTKQLEQAIEGTKVIEQINSLSESMLVITKQTNILALNSAIETSRISGSRNGFNVISKEMKNLAEQSKDTVIEIQNVAIKVKESVDNLSNCSIELSKLVVDDFKIQINDNKDCEK
ncbi:methyl-accepting chemotaxis protein [Clostridium tagluense]|uniref:methyl-accepting chemotaxis protein n=1 Tax=Clostridium tagluense TaxID=360422 RepID=UPI001CF2F55E|nr:methyl-accepting chemotaxis protein [Clostridium tagluense]MCB2300119.1 methyl-accepting chemotaxis protein [Clostridium tagluense]